MMKELGRILRVLVYGWIVAIRDLCRILCRRYRDHRRRESLGREGRRARTPCVPINRPEMKRPDPLLYSQYFLSSLGLAVTWDNPDIELRKGDVTVPSSQLEPNTTYDIVARIWNASTDAPAIQMPVRFSYLSFGVGTVSNPIGVKPLTVGVKGSVDCPALVTMPWTTPAAGHYCIQVLLEPVDDLNYANNLGQENTTVGEAHSPALFDFELRNDTHVQHRYRWQYDSYLMIRRQPCRELPRGRNEEARRKLLGRHAAGGFPIPPGWSVTVSPELVPLEAGASKTIHVEITPPAGFKGKKQFNVNAIREDDVMAGGVTLIVDVT